MHRTPTYTLRSLLTLAFWCCCTSQEVFVEFMDAENDMLRLRASVNECLKVH